jgi:hypothetical protein
MKISLGHHLQDYLHDHHHQTISLELSLKCAPHVGEQFQSKEEIPEPRIVFSQPINLTGYDKYQVKDITVYVAHNIRAKKDELIIMDQVVDGIDTCHVEGWSGQ